MQKILQYTLLLLCFLWTPQDIHAIAESNICNPKPLDDDLELTGPDNTCFVFRPIHVRAASPFDGATFLMGDADSDNFRTPPTRVMLSGSFANQKEEGVWTYYLGKYEVTRAQYRAIMGALPKALAKKNPPIEDDALPVTELTYFEAMQFIHMLNVWIYSNTLEEMPTSGKYPGFVRLPSEVEWEFAARGGSAVEQSVFEASTPYAEQLSTYEWFGGPKSSHGKIKTGGLLKANPLGLYDMLGNVQEMTYTQYQLEYYQGRSGGFVCRGGSYIMNEELLRSSQRQEEPYYLAKSSQMIPNAKQTLGLRLAISAPLLTDRKAIADLEDAWENNRNESTSPAAMSVVPTSQQEGLSVNEALERLKKLRAAPADEAVKILGQELAYAEAALYTTVEIRRKADADAAKVWVGQALFSGQVLQQYIERYESLSSMVKNKVGQSDEAKWKKRSEDTKFMISKTLERYRDSIAALGAITAKIVADALDIRQKEEEAKKGGTELNADEIQRSLQTLTLLRKHYAQFVKNKRADIDAWHHDFMAIMNTTKE